MDHNIRDEFLMMALLQLLVEKGVLQGKVDDLFMELNERRNAIWENRQLEPAPRPRLGIVRSPEKE